MTKRISINGLLFIIGVLSVISCDKETINPTSGVTTENSLEAEKKSYLVLISLDGFRWDYVDRFQPPHLTEFIKNGVRAESLIPSFPSKTFPNHYTIATGMYPDKHGIIGNSFYSYEKDVIYKISDREKVEDGEFYRGTPIWIQANNAQMVTASYFFVGSEADIQGITPTYFYPFDNSVKSEDRVAQALDWLAFPSKKRPHLITMYFSDMDDTGHRFGPNNDEKLEATILELDKHLGALFQGIEKTGLPVNIIIVSDHGMTPVPKMQYLPIEEIENDDLYTVINNGAILNVHPKNDDQSDAAFAYIKNKENHFKVYKTEDTPGFEYRPKNKNWGTIQIIPDFGFYFSSSAGIAARENLSNMTFGAHGYDPQHKDMHGIFYGNGPAFKKDYTLSPIKNIHLYPLMCKILELETPEDIDGKLDEIRDVLKTN